MDAPEGPAAIPALLPAGVGPVAAGPAGVTLAAELRGTALLFGMAVGGIGGVATLAHLLMGLLH